MKDASATLINGRYRVVRKLGEGGMGAVHLVADTIDEESLLALKTIRGDMVSPTKCRLFKNEFRAMTQFSHPNVVEVYDFGTMLSARRSLGADFFTMEFVEGRGLFEACEGADHRTVCGYAVQVCRALEYIHAQNFIHFDLKPENIMVRSDGRVKVMDFGVVGELSFLQPRMLKGTANYIAPEMILGRPIDYRLDLYALGAVLFHVLVRRPLFDGGTVEEVLTHHVETPPDFDHDGVGTLPAALRAVLLRLLAKNPADRFASASAALAALARLTGEDLPATGKPSTRDISESWLLGSRFVGRLEELGHARKLFRDRFVEPRPGRPPLLLVSGSSGIGKSRLLSEFRHDVQLGGVRFIQGSCLQNGGQPYLPFAEILRAVVREIVPALSSGRQPDAFEDAGNLEQPSDSPGFFESLGESRYLSTLREAARNITDRFDSPQPLQGDTTRISRRSAPTFEDDELAEPSPLSELQSRLPGEAVGLAQLVTDHAAALLRLVPEEEALRGLGAAQPHFERPDHEKEWLIGSIARFLIELSRVRPLVLYASDLHWADDLTVELLARLASWVQQEEAQPSSNEPIRLLLCGCLREEEIGESFLAKKLEELARDRVALNVKLRPLAAAEIAAMLHHMLGAVELSDEVSRWLLNRTAGNPFFLEATVRSLLREGTVFRRGATWVFDLPRVQGDRDAPSLTAVLDRTLAGLASAEAAALELLAVFNRPVSSHLFSEANGDQHGPLAKVLLHLRRKRFVERGWADGHYQYGLRHAQLRDHIYSRLGADRRARLHEVVGSAIETVHGDRERYREDLAEHFFRANNFEKAVPYAQAAADQARRMFDLKRAAALYTQAHEATTRLAPTPQGRLLAADLTVAIAENSYYAPSERNIDRLLQALQVVEAAGDLRRAALIWNWMGRTYYALGNQREAMRCFHEFISLAERTGENLTGAGVPYALLGRVHIFLGRFAMARQYLQRAIELLRGQPGADEDLSYALGMGGSAMVLLGDHEQGLPLVEESIAIAQAANHNTRVALGYVYLGIDQAWRGEWTSAREWLEKGIAISKQTGDIIGTGTGSSFLGLCSLVEGDAERSLELSRFGRDHIKAAGGSWTFTMIGSHLVEALTWTGDLDQAWREAKAAQEVMATGERWGESPLSVALGRLHARRGDRQEARRWFDQAIAVAQEQQARPFVAKARLALGAFLCDIGEARAAESELRLAEEAFLAMDMVWYLSKTRALLAGATDIGPCP